MEIKTLKHVRKNFAKDAKNDAINFDGKPLNGKVVAEYFGNQGAAIATLAELIKNLYEEIEELKKTPK